MTDATNRFFQLTGLNHWTTFMKEWSGMIVMSRMAESIDKVGRGAVPVRLNRGMRRQILARQLGGEDALGPAFAYRLPGEESVNINPRSARQTYDLMQKFEEKVPETARQFGGSGSEATRDALAKETGLSRAFVDVILDGFYGSVAKSVDRRQFSVKQFKNYEEFENFMLSHESAHHLLGMTIIGRFRMHRKGDVKWKAGLEDEDLIRSMEETFERYWKDEAFQAEINRGAWDAIAQQGDPAAMRRNEPDKFSELMAEFVSTRIEEVIADKMGRIGRGVVEQDDITKLARVGIDSEMAKRIDAEMKQHGEWVDGVHLPGTEKWTDAEARRVYRGALAAEVDRTIVTPGIGERPHFVSSELGSIFAQFKSFAMASQSRMLIGGIQDPQRAKFLTGVALMVAAGMAADSVRDRVRGRERPRDLKERIVRGVNRSGMLGWFADVNNAVESVSHNAIGIYPLLGEGHHGDNSWQWQAGTLGPTFGTLANAITAAHYAGSGGGTMSWEQASAFRKLVPGNNLWFATRAFDEMPTELMAANRLNSDERYAKTPAFFEGMPQLAVERDSLELPDIGSAIKSAVSGVGKRIADRFRGPTVAEGDAAGEWPQAITLRDESGNRIVPPAEGRERAYQHALQQLASSPTRDRMGLAAIADEEGRPVAIAEWSRVRGELEIIREPSATNAQVAQITELAEQTVRSLGSWARTEGTQEPSEYKPTQEDWEEYKGVVEEQLARDYNPKGNRDAIRTEEQMR
ncbi:MAG: hypothetical protein GVY11_01260 [Gammaproteobacteria bacterium]|jgi:hypothetical protein|nr:hypothetical protein [Gammaproteobacteria bacterium]